MPLLYLPYTIILIFESNGQWKSHFSNHRGQLMGKVSLKTSLAHKVRRGAFPLAPFRPGFLCMSLQGRSLSCVPHGYRSMVLFINFCGRNYSKTARRPVGASAAADSHEWLQKDHLTHIVLSGWERQYFKKRPRPAVWFSGFSALISTSSPN